MRPRKIRGLRRGKESLLRRGGETTVMIRGKRDADHDLWKEGEKNTSHN